jgi:hypothetical protein
MAKAEQALRIANSTKRLLNVEKKHVDAASSFNPGAISASSVLLTGIAQGDTNESRDGSSIKLLSLSIHGRIEKSTSTTSTVVRIVLVHDKVPDGSAPSHSDIFQDSDHNSHYQTENMGTKYSIISDKSYVMSDGGGEMKLFRNFKKLNQKMRFTGTGATISDISQGALWLFAISNETTNTPTLTFRSRCMYVDN